MGGANISDQIHGSYRFDHWLRNFKWWHSIFWWGVQVLMVNSYKCYCDNHKGIQETPMNHYEYQKMIALFWLDKNILTKNHQDHLKTTEAYEQYLPQAALVGVMDQLGVEFQLVL